MPVIVMVTAYDQYALQAFEAGAIDYLLKPVGHQRLAEAVERAKRVSGLEAAEKLGKLQEIGEPVSGQRPKRIVGKMGDEYFLLSADEILAFQAEGCVVWIITGKGKYYAAADPEGSGAAAGEVQLPPDSPERASECGSCAQNGRAQQPEMADHTEQQSGLHRQQAAGAGHPADFEMVTGEKGMTSPEVLTGQA